MDFFFTEESIDFFGLAQTEDSEAAGNHAAVQDMMFESSISYPQSNVPGRRKRNKWAEEEDAILLDAVKKQPGSKKNWTVVAGRVNKASDYEPRTGKQCRERWQNHLRPNIKKGNWTAQEEELICAMFETYGPKWSSMSKLMSTRTDNDIKNKWYSMQRTKKIRKRKATEQKAEKRSLKTRLNERQEILDLISLSKAGNLSLETQDENQANRSNDAHDSDELQPYPSQHQATIESQEVWQYLGLVTTETSEV